MKTKLVQKDKKAEVNGTAKYDSEGKMLIPYKENGKTTLKTQEELKSILDKKDQKQKVGQKAISNTKQKPKLREKKKANPKFRDDFATKAVEQIQGLERKDLDDKVLLKYGKSTLARLMLRTGHRFTCYRKDEQGNRDTKKIVSEADEDALYDWVQKRVEFLKSKAPKPKQR